jgi:hypothetical protein
MLFFLFFFVLSMMEWSDVGSLSFSLLSTQRKARTDADGRPAAVQKTTEHHVQV